MAYLFEVKGTRVVPTAECLSIEPFKSIWEADKSRDKRVALLELSYIEFMTSLRVSNPFSGYPEDIREGKIREHLDISKRWSPSDLVQRGISVIEEFNTEASPSYMFYKDSLQTATRTRDYLRNIDLSERTNGGSPVYKPADVYNALERVDKVIEKLEVLRKKVSEEILDSDDNNFVNPFED